MRVLKSLPLVFLLLVLGSSAWAQRLSVMARPPDWRKLEPFQETITREDFEWLLNNVYAPRGAWKDSIEITPQTAVVRTRPGRDPFVLRFAPSRAEARAIPRFWRGRAEFPRPPGNRPLQGVHIAIDPGHIGGDWARMEERWFQIGDARPVAEGDMTLKVAQILAPQLRALGARVTLTRNRNAPVTSDRPGRMQRLARESLADRGARETERSMQLESERLFYRVSEIRRRAALVNDRFKPDLVLCLHFNAEPWGNPAKPTLTDVNHLHFLVTGAFSAEELSYEDQRHNMLTKLLNRSYHEELAVTSEIARSMKRATGLPPFTYRGPNAVNVGNNPYIWGRNLLANRLFECPVVYAEPYVMNSREVFARIQAGDYRGRRNFGGVMRKSIYREYADALVEGLVNYYTQR